MTVAALDQTLRQMTADEPGLAGDENLHGQMRFSRSFPPQHAVGR
jgi:hypothetical protein